MTQVRKIVFLIAVVVTLLTAQPAKADELHDLTQEVGFLNSKMIEYQEAKLLAVRFDKDSYQYADEKYNKYRERRAVAWMEYAQVRHERAVAWQKANDEAYRQKVENPSLNVIQVARSMIGVPYVWGGESSSGVDCSGLVVYSYRKGRGISLPHYSAALRRSGTGVSLSNAKPGDILCYSGHVALYSGNGNMIESPRTGLTVREKSMRTKGLLSIRRIN